MPLLWYGRCPVITTMPLQLLLLLLLCPGIFGALYCLADVHTEFSEVAKQLKEVAELLGQGLNRQLSGPLVNEFLVRHWHALWFWSFACLPCLSAAGRAADSFCT